MDNYSSEKLAYTRELDNYSSENNTYSREIGNYSRKKLAYINQFIISHKEKFTPLLVLSVGMAAMQKHQQLKTFLRHG